jgi:hypothetical protein
MSVITIEEIKKLAKPHPHRGKMVRLENDNYFLSIVGGDSGLYGDFIEDFEIAIIDKKTDDFVTKFFFPDISDDVMAYMPAEIVEEAAELLFGKTGFRVFEINSVVDGQN